MNSRHPLPLHLLSVVGSPWFCFLLNGLWACFSCDVLAANRWRLRVVHRRTPYWYVVAVAAVCGSLVGGGVFGFDLMPHRSLGQSGMILLFLGGPMLGIDWLVRRPLRTADPDYDDRHEP